MIIIKTLAALILSICACLLFYFKMTENDLFMDAFRQGNAITLLGRL